MFQNIPQNRLLIYLLSLGLIPLLAATLYMSSSQQQIQTVSDNLFAAQEAALLKEGKQALNRRVKAFYKDADHFYIDKQLESIVLLETEINDLKKVAEGQMVGENKKLSERLDFLTQPDNQLSFTEGAVQSFDGIQEVTETLVRPVQVDLDDLHKILSRIEGTAIGGHAPPQGRPQLLVLDFKIEKKNVSGDHEAFTLYTRLLKREFL